MQACYPRPYLNIPKIKQAGLNVSDIMQAMQAYFGGMYVDNFNQFGKQYRIMIQADASYRANEEGLNKVYVRTGNGEMAPITEFITIAKTFGPESISRFNMFTSMSVIGSPNKGYGSGEAMAAIQEVAAETLPQGYGYEYSGLSYEEISKILNISVESCRTTIYRSIKLIKAEVEVLHQKKIQLFFSILRHT